MNGINYLAILLAALAAFIISGLWFSPLLFGKQWLILRGIDPGTPNKEKMRAKEIIGELVRTIIIGCVLAHFIVQLNIASPLGAFHLALWIWVGFYAMIL